VKVVFTPRAQIDLLNIHKNIIQGNAERALTFVNEIESAYATLAEMPQSMLSKYGGRYWDRTSGPCRVKAVLYP
jgi:plasmid stabilization system protein ParE